MLTSKRPPILSRARRPLSRTLLLGCFLSLGTWAQGQEVAEMDLAPPNEHEAKVYVDADRNIYWPEQKPIFFWLGTSSGPDAKLFPILGSDSLPDAELERYRQDGIKLEVSSNQYVRWLHYYSGKETKLRFFADGIVPRTRLQVQAPQKVTRNGVTFYAEAADLELIAQDPALGGNEDMSASGVETAFLSINGQPFTASTGSRLNEEGRYLVRHYAVDRVGNASEPEEMRFTIDRTPPTTTLDVEFTARNGTVIGPRSLLKLTSTDALSGVKEIRYQWGEADFQKDTGKPLDLKALSGKEQVLRFQAEDFLGYAEPLQERRFQFDAIGPEVSHEVEGDQYIEGNRFFISARSRIRLNAVDDQVDVRLIEYRLNRGAFMPYRAPFLPQIQNGPLRLDYQAFDEMNNASVLVTANFIVDDQPPVTELKTDGPTYRRGPNTIWVRSDTRLILNTLDQGSGVKSSFHSIDLKEAQTYTGPLTLQEEGRHTFEFYSMDQVNNREVTTPALIVVDDTPPEIQAVFSIPAVAEDTMNGEAVPVYPLSTTLFFNGIDDSANLKTLKYRLNGGKVTVYDQSIVLKEAGDYVYEIEAEDNLGNTSQQTIQFKVQNL